VVSSLVGFVRRDVMQPHLEVRSDCAMMLDSLMYLPNRRMALEALREAVRPGGLVLLSDVVVRRSPPAELRRFAWETDGMADLWQPQRLAASCEEAELIDVSLTDMSALAVDCFRRIMSATAAKYALLFETLGRKRLAEWQSNNKAYLRLFESGALGYFTVWAKTPER
jgi:hypothetical protein